jgi:predicted nucleotidyltransferase
MRYAERCDEQRHRLDAAAADVVSICRALGDVHAVYAFGSYAAERIGPDSDLDLLIVRETSLRRVLREDAIRERLTISVGYDFVVVTPDEYRDVLPTTSFGRTILAQARRLDAA